MSKKPNVVVVHCPDGPTEIHTWPPESVNIIDIDMRIPLHDEDANHQKVHAWTVGVLLDIVDMDRSPTREAVERWVLGALDEFYGSDHVANEKYEKALREATERKDASRALLR